MAAIKIHVGVLSNDGTESCDFRGDRWIGAEHGDHHRTVLERDPASEEEVEFVLAHGPSFNALLSKLVPAKILGVEVQGVARIGVWDD